MTPYTESAEYYDLILKHVDYHEWYSFIKKAMHAFAVNPRMIIELGCGTGRFGAKFSNDGYLIYGIDCSMEMLRVAKARAFKNFRIFCADITSFSVAKRADFIFCVHDTMNYLLDSEEVRKALRSVRNAVRRDGIFLFDITTEHNIMKNFHNKTMVFRIRGTSIEWSNSYDRDKRLIYSYLRFQKPDGTVLTEEHVQRIYRIQEIKNLLDEEGFCLHHVCGDYSLDPPTEGTAMINLITGIR